MPLNNFFRPLSAALLLATLLGAQINPTLTVAQVPTVKAKKGSTATVTLKAILPPGFHANSHTPSDDYLIPLTLKWTGGPLQAGDIGYPKASMEKYSFSDKPLSVVTGEFEITTSFKVPASAANGISSENGTLRYQACNNTMCFAPKTLNVSVAVTVE